MPEVAPWGLRRRLAIAVTALGVVLAVVVAAAVIILVSVRSQQRAVINRYFNAVSATNQRFTEQVNAETAVRGYALTDQTSTLAPLRQLASPAYPAEVPRIQQLLAGNPAIVAAFNTWNDATRTWYVQWAQPTVAEVTRSGLGAVQPGEVLTGKTLFDTNRERFAEFSQLLVAKRNDASDSLKLRTTMLFGAVILLILGIAVAGGFTWWGQRRWVLAPLAALGAETRLVRSGQLEHEVNVNGPAEIQELARDVEDMRREIVAQLAAVAQAGQEIETARNLVEAQAADLARSNRDLEQFAYVASHDLQEPLRKVASFCQLLESRYRGQLDERADQYIDFAVDGAKRMQQLINDLLAFSRVGRTEHTAAEVDLQRSFDAAMDNLAYAIEAAGATVRAEPLPVVPGDAGLLVQLFQNLIGNAVKFHGADPPEVLISARDAGDLWEFGCIDNGIGIDEQFAERVFVIFQRLHAKDAYAGTGIGLALCKRIVEYHGGEIWLDTSVASGTTVRWTLPKRERATA